MNRLRFLAAALGVAVAVGAMTVAHGAAEDSPVSTSRNSVSATVTPLNACKERYHKLTIVVITGRRNVAEGDRLWDSHHAYMRDSHKSFLVTYTLTKGRELSNPLNPTSAPTGRTMYVLNECYRTSADILAHWSRTAAEWQDFNAIIAWMQKPGTQVVTLHDGRVRNSLWQRNDI